MFNKAVPVDRLVFTLLFLSSQARGSPASSVHGSLGRLLFRCRFEWTLGLRPAGVRGSVELAVKLCRVEGVVSGCRSSKYKSDVEGHLAQLVFLRPRKRSACGDVAICIQK